MKVLALILKIVGTLSILFALIAFGSELLPVEGISFGGHVSAEGEHQFYKIVPVSGTNPIPVGIACFLNGIGLFVISMLVKKKLVK